MLHASVANSKKTAQKYKKCITFARATYGIMLRNLFDILVKLIKQIF